ncbi:phosphopyruvate hydratase [Verminephrobacter eiseniae]|uniref:phosphopyruvate hydratase n=1 Tax=Verminephrobacter eiseniae TaxID=364317 RepID=UPI0022383469|nr:phosphopyruvate hydratase [Verminephrobacter eiseniae]MCW5259036.1 phosphopyruvate hydratase [Verminephrobacter eiseniae]
MTTTSTSTSTSTTTTATATATSASSATERIAALHGRRVWDSRGRPTVEVEITTTGGQRGRAIAPAGASRGSAEASDLRDGGTRLGGYDVLTALDRVRSIIAPALIGMAVTDQAAIDATLDRLDPSPTRQLLGGNATVATSLAALHSAAAVRQMPLWRYLNPAGVRHLARPEVQIIGGGAHAARRVDLQDFMLIPLTAATIGDALVHIAEVHLAVAALFAARGPAHGVADEGGHWPALARNEQALELLTLGIERAGFRPGIDLGISLDIAASEFERDGSYHLAAEERSFSRTEWLAVIGQWLQAYPIIAIEDPASEHDPIGMRSATAAFAARALIVGDDYLVSDPQRIATAAREGACNTALIKVNQAGTVTRAWQAHAAARAAGWATIVSARSGESEDVSVAHLAVGWGADLIKVGAITRGERTAKWNEMLRIDEELGGLPLAPFPLR